jgi:hypothetical protein
MRKPLPNALDIDFAGGLTQEVTPHAGVGLLIDLGRRSGVMAAAERVLPAKKSAKALGQGQMVESFVLLSALGGDCLDDFDNLRRDYGLAAMLGYHLPAASTARQWLDQFHDQEALKGRPSQGSFIPRETDRLAGLKAVLQHCLLAYVTSQKPGPALTLDVDAHLVESAKETALPTYEGFRGYQPLLVSWAETGLVLADEFRDGNVPAGKDVARVVDQAYESLPQHEDGWQVSVRSDSAAYEQLILDHWAERGWRFAVSADMSRQLRAVIEALPPEAWQMWREEADGYLREWAEVAYVPSRIPEQRDRQPNRYLAIRIRPPQGLLFGDGSAARHFAVVTNDWQTEGQALLQWHRGKAGTIEHAHRLLKDELGAGVYPSAKFGANAAWLRLQVITLNLLELLKAAALEPQYRNARPKRLRFAIFTQFGRVVRHARGQIVRIAVKAWDLLKPARTRLAVAAWPSA